MTAEQYFNSPGVSKSSLDAFSRCPAYYHAMHIAKTIKRDATPAMEFGTLLHSLVLDGRADFHAKPDGMNFATKEGKAWREEHSGLPILSLNDSNDLYKMADAIKNHPHAAPLFSTGKPEVSLFAKHKNGLDIKGRLDWLSDYYIVDIKTTTDASDKGIYGSMKSFRYWLQAAFYLNLAKLNGLQNCKDFYFVFIERGGLVNIWQMSQPDIEMGNIVMDSELDSLLECYENDEWPDYSATKPEPRHLPPFVFPSLITDLSGVESFNK